MNSKQISVAEALKLLKDGKKLEGVAIDFNLSKVKALDAFKLGQAGIDVPDEVIEYDDADVAYDPDFDDYEWKRTEIDPFNSLKERLTVNIEIEGDVKAWIQKNGIESQATKNKPRALARDSNLVRPISRVPTRLTPYYRVKPEG